ncbi:cell division protein FtsA [bacterium]|nr:cell division protein FtsA [bacterium]
MPINRHIVTGIDVGTHSVRAVIADWNSDTGVPRILGIGTAESRGLRYGYIVNQTEAAKSIAFAVAKAEKASGIKVRHAFLSSGGVGLEGYTGYGATMVSRADNEVSSEDIEKAIAASETTVPGIQNKKVIYLIPLGFRLDGKEVLGKPEGMKGIKLEVRVLFVTMLAAHVADLISASEEAGVEVDDILPSPVAASMVTLTRQQKTAGCLLANVGAETVSIVVFENNTPVSLKVFPLGSTDITNDIALGFRISLEEAEEVKTGRANDPRYARRRLEEIVQARLSDIFELIDAHLKKIDRSELLPAGIVLTGGGSDIDQIADLAKTALKIPSRIGYPSFGNGSNGNITSRGALRATKASAREQAQGANYIHEIKNIPAWTVAYGLCVMGLFAEKEDRGLWSKLRGVGRKIANFLKQFLP